VLNLSSVDLVNKSVEPKRRRRAAPRCEAAESELPLRARLCNRLRAPLFVGAVGGVPPIQLVGDAHHAAAS
jgi:hypothetical protein